MALIKCHKRMNQWNKAYKYCSMRYDPLKDRYDPVEGRYESKRSRSQTSYFLIITVCMFAHNAPP